MEPSPAVSSRPTPLRLAGFLLTVAGALLAGIGAAGTWVTVGLTNPAIETPTPGTDLWEGKVVLAGVLVMLVAVLLTRVATTARRAFASLVLATGIAVALISGVFVATADARFNAVDSDKLVAVLADALDVPPERARDQLARVIGELGGFTDVGGGAYLAAAGGVLGFLGGALVLSWSSRPDPA